MSRMCLIIWLCAVILITGLRPLPAADDNLLAYSLYQQGEYAKAGEIFTDPAWKGMALYRSSQWWRAAEAFVRANDPLSAYNLGNCYVKLGYYALALDAYQRALALDPTLDDARHNADIMRKILSSEQQEQQRGGRQPSGEEIETVESDSPDAESGQVDDSDAGDQDGNEGERAPGESEGAGEQTPAAREQAMAGDGGESTDNNDSPESQQGEGGGAVEGQVMEEEAEIGRPSGGAETDEPLADSESAGIRTTLETEQATTQWLNRIKHDPALYLQRRLKLEQRRRRAAGQSPPQGGSTW